MTFLRTAILVLVVTSAFWSARVEAQRGCTGLMGICELRTACSRTEPCVTGTCDLTGGFCIPVGGCRECCVPIPGTDFDLTLGVCTYDYPCDIVVNPTSTARSQPTTCFHEGRWEAGDCDGDGNINGPLEDFVEADCAQLAAIIDGNITQVPGSLATSCVPTAVDLGDESCAYMTTASARLIGRSCDLTDPCGEGGRCVIDGETNEGVCVYPRVDDGRLTPTDEMTCFDGACVDRLGMAPNSFANGDCDQDGLTNRVDPDVCEPVRAVNASLSTNEVIVTEGGMRPLSPVHNTNLPGFAFDCSAGREHCPILDDGSDERVHCVDLPGEMMVIGSACTYSLGPLPDRSCLAAGASFARDACAYDGGTAYESWAEGDCDGDGEINKRDELVCDATPVPSDAATSFDAGGPLPDGGATNVDAGSVNTADGGSITFGGGGGCACRAQGGSNHGWMLILLAFAPMLRRARARKV